MENIPEILKQFGLNAYEFHFQPITSGHINSTFKLYSKQSSFILQKVNTDIFKKPEYIMHNIDITQKLLITGYTQKNYSLSRIPEYLKANGKNYCVCNGFWRICRFIEHSEVLPNKESVKAFGAVLGEFHGFTEYADVSKLYITIPDFHNIEKNISRVLKIKGITSAQYKLYTKFLDFYCKIKKLLSPVRLVHNDVKWANALTNPKTLLPDTLIDYDTIMPGYAAFDFGDAVRSACVNENNEIDCELLSSFSEGYFKNHSNISPDEATAGILSVTAELSARYLFDVLTDSDYFSGLSNNEKLNKHCRNFELAEYIMDNFDAVRKNILMQYCTKTA